MRGICCVGAVVGMLALGASSAVASDGAPTSPDCTFSKGISVCRTSTTTTGTETDQAPDAGPGCTQTYEVTTTTTTVTTRRGAPGSQGQTISEQVLVSVLLTPVGDPVCPST
jgi:hypothetical protein